MKNFFLVVALFFIVSPNKASTTYIPTYRSFISITAAKTRLAPRLLEPLRPASPLRPHRFLQVTQTENNPVSDARYGIFYGFLHT